MVNLIDFPAFQALQFQILYIQIFGSFISFLLNILWIKLLISHQRVFDLFPYSAAAADTLRSISSIVFGLIHATNGSYSTGFVGCQIDGYITITTASISTMSLLCLILDPLLIVVFRKSRLTTQMRMMILSNLWTGIPILSLIPIVTDGAKYHIHQTGTYCMICFTCLQNYWNVIVVYLTMGGLLSVPIGMLITFSLTYYIITKRANSSGGATSVEEIQRELIKRGLTITIFHALAWFPSLAAMISTMHGHYDSQSMVYLDIVAQLTGIFALSINPIIFFYLEGHALKMFKKFQLNSSFYKLSSKSVKSSKGSNQVNVFNPNTTEDLAVTRIIPK
ncbi:hypothetical protein BC833DRAFT_606458 [Globomyces pollinis-pini]|nr:hypothetical protein BC833DRAFT_606458 [Globomyces pollinis-pini]